MKIITVAVCDNSLTANLLVCFPSYQEILHFLLQQLCTFTVEKQQKYFLFFFFFGGGGGHGGGGVSLYRAGT